MMTARSVSTSRAGRACVAVATARCIVDMVVDGRERF
jgi:hypothetical protein